MERQQPNVEHQARALRAFPALAGASMLPPASPEQNMQRAILVGFALGLFATAASAAPDEDKLGKAQHYPVGTPATWLHEELRVGSFTHQGEIPGFYHGTAHVLAPAAHPLPLPKAPAEPAYRWSIGAAHALTVDDYLARQRIMGLLIVKDGVIQLERYQYERTQAHRFNSQSMAKSITALAIGIALGEGRIRSVDDRAEDYAPKLKGTLYGGTKLRDLLRMASGARYLQTYDFTGDTRRFFLEISRVGVEGAAQIITERAAPPGTLFHYAGADSAILGAALRGAVGESLSAYLTPRLWQAIGAETSALWRADRTGLEVTFANFNATLRDYARLGTVLAYDGARPDDLKTQIIPREYLLDATDWHRQPPAFRPGKATPYFGYGYQFWLFPGEHRRFAMFGVYGQSIFVDPGLRLVMVETGVNATPEMGKTSLDHELMAFWRGVVEHYGKW
jgi:CubicO group peptidase (beta-lactamase class C family)